MEGWFARYLDYLSAEKGLAVNTLVAYRSDLERLRRVVGSRCRLEQATSADLTKVLRRMRTEGRSPRSVARWIVAVRGFFSYLVAQGVVKEDPSTRIDSPSVWRKLPRVLTFAEVEAVLSAPDRSECRGSSHS